MSATKARIHVVFTNGGPGVGKDKFIEFAGEFGVPKGIKVEMRSSIECIRRLLRISPEDKRPETRKVLSVVGLALEEYNNYRSAQTIAQITREAGDAVNKEHFNQVYFVPVREWFMINSMSTLLGHIQNNMQKQKITFYSHTLLITRPIDFGDALSNSSDIEAAQANAAMYNVVVNNDSDLLALRQKANKFIQGLFPDMVRNEATDV